MGALADYHNINNNNEVRVPNFPIGLKNKTMV